MEGDDQRRGEVIDRPEKENIAGVERQVAGGESMPEVRVGQAGEVFRRVKEDRSGIGEYNTGYDESDSQHRGNNTTDSSNCGRGVWVGGRARSARSAQWAARSAQFDCF